MKLVERSFRLSAPEGPGPKPRPELIGPVLSHLHDTRQDAVRMGFLHSSRARGRISSALKAAAEVRYLGHSADGADATVLRFEVAPFGEAAAELFKQRLLWDDGPQPEQTAFELLSTSLADIPCGARLSPESQSPGPKCYERVIARRPRRFPVAYPRTHDEFPTPA